MRIESAFPEERLALPDFYVLLIETDTLGFFHATDDGFDPEVVPQRPDFSTDDEPQRSNMIVTSEALVRAWLEGAVPMNAALEHSMVMVDAPARHVRALWNMLQQASLAETSNLVL